MLSLSSSLRGSLVSISVIGWLQVRPPSVDLLTCTPPSEDPNGKLGPAAALKNRLLAYRSPLGAKESQGSLARANVPPVVRATPGSGTAFQLFPWSMLTLTTSPRAPPSFQRSCCQIPTRL